MTHYQTLGVDEKASDNEIKKAYRKLSMKHHPDKGGDPEQFKKINEAYQTLGDRDKKKRYDMERQSPFAGGMPGGMPFQNDDMFKMFFGGGVPGMGNPHQNNPNIRRQFTVYHNGVPININQIRKPQPITKTIEIDIKEVYNGVNMPIEIERWIQQGNVRNIEKEKVYIEIEPGTDSNEILVIKEKGNIRDNMKGDVKLHIKIKNNTGFQRSGLDLIYDKTITLKEALIGFNFKIDHINGKSFTINNMGGNVIKPGYAKIAKNMGMKRKDKVGNLVIKFNIVFPDTLTEEQKKQLEKTLS